MLQGLFDWWNPLGVATAPGEKDVARRGGDGPGTETTVDASEGCSHRELSSLDSAASLTGDEVSDPELLDFLAADHDPAEANPDFKRKLREQLWAMVRDHYMTRQ